MSHYHFTSFSLRQQLSEPLGITGFFTGAWGSERGSSVALRVVIARGEGVISPGSSAPANACIMRARVEKSFVFEESGGLCPPDAVH